MKNTVVDGDAALKKAKQFLKSKSHSIDIKKITTKKNYLIVEESESVRVKIKAKRNGISIQPHAPSIK